MRLVSPLLCASALLLATQPTYGSDHVTHAMCDESCAFLPVGDADQELRAAAEADVCRSVMPPNIGIAMMDDPVTGATLTLVSVECDDGTFSFVVLIREDDELRMVGQFTGTSLRPTSEQGAGRFVLVPGWRNVKWDGSQFVEGPPALAARARRTSDREGADHGQLWGGGRHTVLPCPATRDGCGYRRPDPVFPSPTNGTEPGL